MDESSLGLLTKKFVSLFHSSGSFKDPFCCFFLIRLVLNNPPPEIVIWSILACLFIAKRSLKDLQDVFYQDLEIHQFKKEIIDITMKVKNELLQALESSRQSSKKTL